MQSTGYENLWEVFFILGTHVNITLSSVLRSYSLLITVCQIKREEIETLFISHEKFTYGGIEGCLNLPYLPSLNS